MKRRSLPPAREDTSRFNKKWRVFGDSEWAVYALVASVGALTYANSLHGDFVHDDIPAIASNRDVIGASPVYMMFNNDFWGTPMSDAGSHKSYRPLTTLTFRMNHWLCGLRPWWWHAGNVALHAACCALVSRAGEVVARLRRPFAALAGLLFAVHPVHTEAVAGVVGRADVLACAFFLSSILLYHGSTSGRRRVGASVVLAALAMLAKEVGLTVLLFNVSFDVYRCWGTIRKCASGARSWSSVGVCRRVVVVMMWLAVLVMGRLAVLRGSLPAFSPQDNPPAFHPSFAVRLMTFCYLAALNWWLVLCPWQLSHDWQMGSVPLVASPLDPRNLLTCAALIALLALVYTCLMDLETQRHSATAAGLLLLAAGYLPASNLLVTVGFVIAERVLYIPSVGSVMMTAHGVQLLWRRGVGWRRLLACSLLVLVASGVARTYLRNRDWRSKETLLRADLAVLPHNAKLHYNFANFLKDVEEQDNAIKHYKEALRLWPGYSSAHNNLGTLVVAAGGAEHHFLQAIKYNRDHVNAHYNLGKLYRKKNRLVESRRMLERCVTLAPRFVQAHLELMLLTPPLQRRPSLDTLLALERDNWEHHVLYGDWYRDRGLKAASLRYYLEALRLALKGRGAARVSRGELVALSCGCRLLRDLGQAARILQLITRWRGSRGSGEGGALLLRGWRLRSELSGRARLYSRTHHKAVTSTCLHHSHLEVSQESYNENFKQNKINTRTVHLSQHQNTPSQRQLSEPASWSKVENIVKCDMKSSSNECEKLNRDDVVSKRSVSIPALYKPTHNKSESGHKSKSCPLHKNNVGKMKQEDALAPFISDHLIKTY